MDGFFIPSASYLELQFVGNIIINYFWDSSTYFKAKQGIFEKPNVFMLENITLKVGITNIIIKFVNWFRTTSALDPCKYRKLYLIILHIHF